MNPEFKNLDELKIRMIPALRIRMQELKKENINITIDELWICFIRRWKNLMGLTLSDLVNDVLNTNIKEIL